MQDAESVALLFGLKNVITWGYDMIILRNDSSGLITRLNLGSEGLGPSDVLLKDFHSLIGQCKTLLASRVKRGEEALQLLTSCLWKRTIECAGTTFP